MSDQLVQNTVYRLFDVLRGYLSQKNTTQEQHKIRDLNGKMSSLCHA